MLRFIYKPLDTCRYKAFRRFFFFQETLLDRLRQQVLRVAALVAYTIGCSNLVRGEKVLEEGEGYSWGSKGEPMADVTKRKRSLRFFCSLRFVLKGV